MNKYRVKAYFMHESEQAAASAAVSNSVITEAEMTQGFVMGVVDEADIETLKSDGLVVSIVEQIAPPGTAIVTETAPLPGTDDTSDPVASAGPGLLAIAPTISGVRGRVAAQRVPVAVENRDPASKILSHDPRRRQVYVVRFHGSITEDRRKAIKKLKIKLLERLTRNKYSVELLPSEVGKLAALEFVDYLRLYTENDTLRVEDAGAAPEVETVINKKGQTVSVPKSETRRTSLYNVKLHQKKDLGAIVKWLTQRKRKPLWKRGDQLQVALLENSRILIDLASRPEVATVEQVEAPRLYDSHARSLLGLVQKNKKIGLEGAGEIIGIADTGIDLAHPDFANRILGVSAWGRPPKDVSDPEGHGTHVAGCVLGDGSASNGEVVGAAPKAKLFFQSILDKNGKLGGLPDDIGKLLKEAYDKGARIHNNSWGAFGYARYSNTSLDVDRFVASNPDMLVVIAGGNDGIGIPRKAGAQTNAAKGFVDWPCVAAPATAKNGLTVGASRSSRKTGGYAELTWSDAWPDRYPDAPIAHERISSDDQCLAAFSSRGPSDDQRIKPDVVAPGTDIAAARSKDAPLHKFWGAYPKNDKYGFMGGTSMAAPYVAGCAALVREWYRTSANWDTPSAALLKATLINGTQRIKGADAVAEKVGDPNFHQGFGRIDMANTVPSPLSPKLRLAHVDAWVDKKAMFTKTGERFRFSIETGSDLPLRFCLAWTDPAARGLQNSLLLLVDDQSGAKWAGNQQAATLMQIAGGPNDTNNNVQIIRIDKPKKGVHTIVVFASMILIPPQSYALVVTGDLKSSLTPLS